MGKGEFRYFDRKKGKRVSVECTLHKTFYFAKQDFYLVEYGGWYIVCLVFNGDLISLYKRKIVEGDTQVLIGEVISDFRKQWQKNNINEEKLYLFVSNPLEYEKKYKPTNS